MFDGIKHAVVGHQVAENRKEALMGKFGPGLKATWNFLDGWKSWIVAIVAVYKLMCATCAGAGYVDAILHALGYDTVTAAFDPKQAAMAFGVLVALGHHLAKAVQQYRAGVPVQDIHSNPIP